MLVQMNLNIHAKCVNCLYMVFVMKKKVIIDVLNARMISGPIKIYVK